MLLVQIAGRLGQDPETRFTPKGQKVTTLRVATNVRRGKVEKTVWWKVTLWGETFDRMLPFLKKGSAVFIMGEMDAPEMYQDREGNTQVSLGMTASYIGFNPFGSGKSENPNEPQTESFEHESNQSSFAPSTRGAAKPQSAQVNPFADDDIPF